MEIKIPLVCFPKSTLHGPPTMSGLPDTNSYIPNGSVYLIGSASYCPSRSCHQIFWSTSWPMLFAILPSFLSVEMNPKVVRIICLTLAKHPNKVRYELNVNQYVVHIVTYVKGKVFSNPKLMACWWKSIGQIRHLRFVASNKRLITLC